MKIFIALATFLAPTVAFVPVVQQSKTTGLFSTSAEVVEASSGDALKIQKPYDDSWVAEQFSQVHPLSVMETSKKMEHDWFHNALQQGPTVLKSGLQVEEGDFSALDRNSFHGILPTVPPVAPSFESLRYFHLEPDFNPQQTTNAFLQKANVEWFSEAVPALVKSEQIMTRNGLNQGVNEWFSAAIH